MKAFKIAATTIGLLFLTSSAFAAVDNPSASCAQKAKISLFGNTAVAKTKGSSTKSLNTGSTASNAAHQ